MARLLPGQRRGRERETGPRPPRGEGLRLFVAIELPESTRAAIERTIAALKRVTGEEGLRWVRPEGVHLTLAFLGATPPDRLRALTAALEAAVRDVAPFTLTPHGVGSFGGRARLRTIWLAVEGDGGALADLARRVEAALQPLGYQPDGRPFNGHLTLARVRDGASHRERARLHDAIAGFEAEPAPPFTVDAVSLMESTLGPGGSVYRRLASVPLRGGHEGDEAT